MNPYLKQTSVAHLEKILNIEYAFNQNPSAVTLSAETSYQRSRYFFKALVEDTPSLAKPLFTVVQSYVDASKINLRDYAQFIELLPQKYQDKFAQEQQHRVALNAKVPRLLRTCIN